MIDLLNEVPDAAFLATLLLAQAHIPPDGDPSELDDQYEIDEFKIDVEGIVITNRGKQHRLRTYEL
jgi:hypothetical protein